MKHTSKNLFSLGAVILTVVLSNSVPAVAQYDAMILEAEPFAYWRLGDDDGETFPLYDGVGTEIEATAENVEFGADSLVPGETNGAARFNGVDSLIRVPDDGQTNSGGPYEEKSVELWFSADDALTETPQVLFEVGGTTRGLAMYVHDGSVFMGAWNRANDDGGVSSPWMNPEPETGPDENSIYVSREIESETVYHAALVMDGDPAGFTGTFTGYLNGVPFGTQTGVGQIFNHGDDMGIGGMDTNIWLVDGTNPGGDGLYFSGLIDEVALYNTALTPAQIENHALLETVDLPGDFNLDGTIDAADFMLLTDNFGGTFSAEESLGKGDFNRDRKVDMRDFRDFRAAFAAAQGGGGAAAIPEPSSLWLFVAGAFFLARIRRSRGS